MGPLSGVERELVELAWRQLVPQTVCSDSALVLEEIPLCCRCRGCGHGFQLSKISFVCPECSSDSIEVTGGDEFRLLDVTIRATITTEGSAG